jgi:hypothetical protein
VALGVWPLTINPTSRHRNNAGTGIMNISIVRRHFAFAPISQVLTRAPPSATRPSAATLDANHGAEVVRSEVNVFLDRSLLVPTMRPDGSAFFRI